MLASIFTRRVPRIAALIVAVVAIIGGSAAIGVALSGTPDTIDLVITGSTARFEYGGTVQELRTGSNACDVKGSSLNGPIIEVGATTYDWRGRVVPAQVGLVHRGIGVNTWGFGYFYPCATIDYLGSGKSEALTLGLGDVPQADGKLISSIDFDLESKFTSKVKFEFLKNGAVIGTQVNVLEGTWSHDIQGSDDDECDEHDHHYCRQSKFSVTASTEAGLFDAVRISVLKGAVSVEGGDRWEAPAAHHTVFHLEGTEASIAIDARTNGTDDPYIEVGEPVTWTYDVTNTGDQDITSFAVTDDQLGPITCPVTSLAAGESTLCSATGEALAGPYANTATVTGTGEYGDEVEASDTSGYIGSEPGISIVVTTNGDDGLYIPAGDPVTFSYVVENTGNVPLSGIVVTDSVLGELTSCPTSLGAGTSFTCDVAGTAETSTAGVFYANVGDVSGTPPVGDDVTASDASSYFGFVSSYSYEVANNGPLVTAGDPVIWTFMVTNTGNVPIGDVIVIEVVDEGDDPISCTLATDETPLAVGETRTCEIQLESAAPGEQPTQFVIKTTDPNGEESTSEPIESSYYGGQDCGESSVMGGPDLSDDPRAGFFVGPDKVTGNEDCAVPVEITTSTEGSEGGPVQIVNVGPPVDYTWNGVTGVVTIEWDAEPSSDAPILRTRQVFADSTEAIVPWCTEVIPLSMGTDGYELADVGALYSTATGTGDVCLISQSTSVVIAGPTPWTQTVEAFYVWNDPKFAR